jgi:hypothetical protein
MTSLVMGACGGHVALAVGAVVDDFAVAGEDGDDAGDLLLVDGLLHEGVQALEALGGEADGFGLNSIDDHGGSSRLVAAEDGLGRRILYTKRWRS